MNILGLNSGDVRVYFTAHAKTDPHYAKKILYSLSYQVSNFTELKIKEMIYGTCLAIAEGGGTI
ncbi:MAG: hypothetical protein ABI045_00035 [Flavobacteriales bacterium]